MKFFHGVYNLWLCKFKPESWRKGVYVLFDFLGIEISRPYTIVVPSFDFLNTDENNRHLYVIIKIYPSGTLTPSLLDVNVGEYNYVLQSFTHRGWSLTHYLVDYSLL